MNIKENIKIKVSHLSRFSTKEKFIHLLQYINLINLLIGFFFINILYSLLSIENVLFITYPYRILSVMLSFTIIYTGRKHSRLPNKTFLLLFFFVLYLLRILYDKDISQITYKRDYYYYIAIFLGSCVIPFISILYTDLKKINFNKLFFIIYVFLIVFASYTIIFHNTISMSIRSNGNNFIAPTSFGEIGTSLSSLSLCVWWYNKNNKQIFPISIITSITFLLGAYIIFMSASKGPFFSLIILTTLIFIFLYEKRKYILLVLLISALLITLIGYFNKSTSSILLFERVKDSFLFIESSTLQRFELLKIAFQKFWTYPLTGFSMLITEQHLKSFSPHNIIAHAFMSTGILGGIISLYILIWGLKMSKILLKNKYYFFILVLFMQYVINALTASSIHTATFFWVLFAIVIQLTTIQKDKLKKNKTP